MLDFDIDSLVDSPTGFLNAYGFEWSPDTSPRLTSPDMGWTFPDPSDDVITVDDTAPCQCQLKTQGGRIQNEVKRPIGGSDQRRYDAVAFHPWKPVTILERRNSPFKQPNVQDNDTVPRHQRLSHVNAEKRRRKDIHEKLRLLQEVVPELRPLRGSKKLNELECLDIAGCHIRGLKLKLENLESERTKLKKEKEILKRELNQFQSALPHEGFIRQDRPDQTMEERYMFYRTAKIIGTWKYGLFHHIVGRYLMDNYIKCTRETRKPNSFIQSLMKWTDHCLNLVHLRPVVISGLQDLAINTSVLTQPDLIRIEVVNIAPQVLHASNTDPASTTTSATVTSTTPQNTVVSRQNTTSNRQISTTVILMTPEVNNVNHRVQK